MPLRARNDIHLARRIWHVCGVLTMVAIYWVMIPWRAAVVASLVSGAMISVDVLRLFSPRLNAFFMWIFAPVLRQGEQERVSGATAMMAGVTFITWVYPRSVVLLTLLFFAVADPMASFVGIRYGKDKLVGNKSLQGSLAAFISCFIIAAVYFHYFKLMPERLFIVCLLAALIGAASELVPVGKLDDNFVFPVLSATLLTGLFYVFGGF